MAASVKVLRKILIMLIALSLVLMTALHFCNSIVNDAYGPTVINHKLFNTEHLSGKNDHPFRYDFKRLFTLEPNIDRSPLTSEVEKVQRQNPNIPIVFWNVNKNKQMFYKNESCAKFPSLFDLHYNNRNWQTLHTTNGTFQLYGAYYETRELSKIKPAIRILGLLNRIEPTVKTHCQLWFPRLSEPVIVKVWEYHLVWFKEWGRYEQGIYQPYLIACKIPTQYQTEVPASVSLVEKPCDTASNHLRVIYNKPSEKKDFAVCVKGLDFSYDDLSVRVIEWIEVLLALGVDKIFLYEFDVHPNISKVLNYYQNLGRVEVTSHSLPAEKPNLPGIRHMYLSDREDEKNQLEIIPYNDCFYKNMYAYRYIVLLDTDEVIMPERVTSWKELMEIVEVKALAEWKEPGSTYSVRNVYFFDSYNEDYGWFENIPKFMYMLQHVYRTKNFSNPFYYAKTFFNTERALGLNNHYTFSCLTDCIYYSIPTSDAKLQHYRFNCHPELWGVCDEFYKNVEHDTSIWKIKDKVIEETVRTLIKLGFLNLEDILLQ